MSTTHSSPSSQNLHATTPAPGPNAAVSTAVLLLSSLPPIAPAAPPVPPADPEVDKWVAEINEAVHQGVIWFIHAGTHLINAKAVLGSDRWLGMFDSFRIAMSERTAQMMMRIARNQGLANANHVSELPPTLTALYALSGASVEAVTAGIQSGDINPDMTAGQARAFVRTQNGSPAPAKPATSFDPDKRRNRVQQAVKNEALRWPDNIRCQLAELLEALAKDIRVNLPPSQQP